MIKACIFDLDGTLLDSMHVWDDFAYRYVTYKKIKADKNLDAIFSTLRMEEAIAYLHTHYVVNEPIQQIETEVYTLLKQRYTHMELKPGVKQCLRWLSKQPITMVVLSANHRDVCEVALREHGLWDMFSYVISLEDIHLSKSDPACFLYVQEKLQVPVQECLVIEDAYHAVQGAKKAGCRVVGVKEKSQRKDEDKIRQEVDAFIEDMQELEELICKKF